MKNEFNDLGEVLILALVIINVVIAVFAGPWWLLLSLPLSYIVFTPYDFEFDWLLKIYLVVAETIAMSIITPWFLLLLPLTFVCLYLWRSPTTIKALFIMPFFIANIAVFLFLGWMHLIWSIPLSVILNFNVFFHDTWRKQVLEYSAFENTEDTLNWTEWVNDKKKDDIFRQTLNHSYPPDSEDEEEYEDGTEEYTHKKIRRSIPKYHLRNGRKEKFSFAEYLNRPSHQTDEHLIKNIGRLLVPFKLFEEIDRSIGFKWFTQSKEDVRALRRNKAFKNVILQKRGYVNYEENKYYFEVLEKPRYNGRWKYKLYFRPEEINNQWHNVITVFQYFELILEKNFHLVTAYPTGHGSDEFYAEKIIRAFANKKFDELESYASGQLADVIAATLIITLCAESGYYSEFLTTAKDNRGWSQLVIAANDEELVMYAFDKQQANLLARAMDGIYDSITVVYFVNSNFERQSENYDIKRNATSTISIKEFMKMLNVDSVKKRDAELGICFLLHILNEEGFRWINDELGLKKQILNADNNSYYDISNAILEDALNTLVEDEPVDKLDVFHFLCAANVVNAYMAYYRKKFISISQSEESQYNTNRMWSFKKHVFDVFEKWKGEDVECVHFAFSTVNENQRMLIANTTIEGEHYQFRFMGMSNEFVENMKRMGVGDQGVVSVRHMQPIAPLLYKYSYCIRARKNT